jgi:16S rRNA (cytosine1402-N4)-methyltransferase
MIKTADTYHVPVLLRESVDGLDIKPDGVYIDVTFGGGGHSKEILSRLDGKGHLYSFDQDADAEGNIVNDDRFTFVRSNFRYIKNWMRYYGVERIDGLLADLGVSSHHFDDESRGFSFRYEAPLDMRMNKRAGQTAADVLNDYDEERIADVLYIYMVS